MTTFFLFSLLVLFSLSLCSSAINETSPTTNIITIPFSTFPSSHSNPQPSDDPTQTINFIASSSLTRAQHLKHPKSTPNSSTKTPLFPHSYGAYSISLDFGTPPQTLSFIFDTGSSLVWFPCTSRYNCSDCSFPNIDPTKSPKFLPKLSSSAKIIGCRNPKCALLFDSDVKFKCQNCDPKTQSCSQACPSYLIQYGSGATAGLLLSETLNFPKKKVSDFLVGCSFLSIHQAAGIAGFGRGPESLPSQLGLKKFSYCLLSRKFDDTSLGSDLVLDFGSNSGDDKTSGVSYTPFRKNPALSNKAYQEYYYVSLRKIIVGDKAVKIPYKYSVPGPDGNGGTIIDSGSTFTFLEKPVFEAVVHELEKQLGNYTRAGDIETQTGLRACFDISNEKSVGSPELIFHFKGGAKLALPLKNYFALVTSSRVVCLTFLTDSGVGPAIGGGPAIILGAFQLQNFYVVFDLVNNRLGFRKQSCTVK